MPLEQATKHSKDKKQETSKRNKLEEIWNLIYQLMIVFLISKTNSFTSLGV